MKTKLTAETLYRGIGSISDHWITLAQRPAEPKTNRHFVGYELKKLFGIRYLWAFLAVLLLLNGLIAWHTAGKSMAGQEEVELIAGFFDDYFANTEEYEAHYAEILAFNEEQNRLWMEAMREGNMEFETESMPSIYSENEDYPDQYLFHFVHNAINTAKDYPSTLQKVIDRAKANLAEFAAMGITEDSFTYRYQVKVIRLYELARDNVTIGVEYTRGWGAYFAYDLVNVFLFIMLIMLGSLVFAQEKQSGFLPIIRTARYGRAHTALAKILAAILLSLAFTLLFTLSTWAIFGLRTGYSSPANAIQVLNAFTLSPHQITIGEYFLLTLAVKMLTFALFTVIILTVSTIFYNYILIYLSGLGLFGLNFLLYTLKYINANSPLKNLNFVAVSAVNPLFERYRAVNFFGGVWGYVSFMFTLFSLLTIGLSVLTIWLYRNGVREIRPAWADKLTAFAAEKAAWLRGLPLRRIRKRKNGYSRGYSLSLLAAESFKTLISSRFIVVVVILLTIKGVYSADLYHAGNSFSDAVYQEYMTTLEGPVTGEKLAYLAEERAMINETLARYEQVRADYIAEKIAFDEYSDYLSDYNYAYSRTELLTIIEEHARYLTRLEEETGRQGWFMYDTGWRRLYSGDADLFLYVTILLLLTGTFASEYVSRSSAGSFAQILRSTKHGRAKTFTAKLISAGMIAVVLAVLFSAVDIIAIAANYEMPAIDAPLISMQMFGSVSGNISVGVYLLIFLILRVLAAVLMAMLVCALSELLCRYIPVLGAVVLLTLLPALCAYFGLAIADRVNFLNLLAGTPLVLQSAATALFGSGWSLLGIWLTAAIAGVATMLASARKMFVK